MTIRSIYLMLIVILISYATSARGATWVDCHADDWCGFSHQNFKLGSVELATDSSTPDSTKGVFKFTLNQGLPTGGGVAVIWMDIPDGTKEWWLRYYYKYSVGFKIHSVGFKHAYLYTFGSETSNHMISTSGASSPKFKLLTQGNNVSYKNYMPNRNENIWYSPGSTGYVDGSWHKVKIYFKFNVGDSYNGKFKMWVDDVLISDYSDVAYDFGFSSWKSFAIYPIWGGIAEDCPQTQYFYVDGVYAGSTDPAATGKMPSAPNEIRIE